MSIISEYRKAFTMLELVFVIMILGIVASIASELITKVYDSYITQRSQHRASIKTQLVSNQIANRLRYAIPGTIIRRVGIAGAAESIEDILAAAEDTYTVLQWVGSDRDSFQARNAAILPGWSGFCDLDASTATVINTPGSNLALTSAIIGSFGGAVGNSAIFFPNDNGTERNVSTVAGTNITLDNPAPRIVERYKLAWTSYALSVEGGDLFLYYNFAPALGVAIPAVGVGNQKRLLLQNVVNFKFQGAGDSIRIKLCAQEDTGAGMVNSCKEKVIF